MESQYWMRLLQMWQPQQEGREDGDCWVGWHRAFPSPRILLSHRQPLCATSRCLTCLPSCSPPAHNSATATAHQRKQWSRQAFSPSPCSGVASLPRSPPLPAGPLLLKVRAVRIIFLDSSFRGVGLTLSRLARICLSDLCDLVSARCFGGWDFLFLGGLFGCAFVFLFPFDWCGMCPFWPFGHSAACSYIISVQSWVSPTLSSV
jgi:hypothetical protein